ncbi:GTP cyclohydrolase I FolE [Reinekea thalattae]|uniref:GTP cyclohydrolase 1 n=1 Tax=Reinekea thalattae TaxID=2593301 RepID=A0A5C8ZB04_9GAMM|nr:GTP cyclohydrolase I FolE [Reinekea thalattae]TXR54368.1 GTP cyclohydrolase I FolE [Reinekea thalattae]
MSISAEALAVHNKLIELGMETPMLQQRLKTSEQKAKIETLMREVMQVLALDLSDDSLSETPERIAKMYVSEVFSGLSYENFPKITLIENKMGVSEMIRVKDIGLTSTCEHHFVTIDGTADVAYIPDQKIIGLSKINRIVRFFAQRPQVQERLNQQVLIALQTLLGTDNVAVKMNATHFCVKSRGVMDSTSSTETLSLGGRFLTDKDLRREFSL